MLNDKGYLNFGIENFGLVKEGYFDICPLTIFTGPNNSGKSFASLLFHCLTSLNLEDIFSENKNFHGDWENLLTNFDKKFKKNLEAYTHQSIERELIEYLGSEPDLDSEPFIFPQNLLNKLAMKIIGYFFINKVENNMKSFFGKDLNDLTWNHQSESVINFKSIFFTIKNDSLSLSRENIIIENNEELDFSNGDVFAKIKTTDGKILFNFNYPVLEKSFLSYLNTNIPESLDNKNNDKEERNFLDMAHDKPNSVMYSMISNIISNIIFNVIFRTILSIFSQHNSYYIPVGRTEIAHNLKNIISQNLINEENGFSQAQKYLTNDFVTMDYDKKGDFYDLATELEHELFKGSIEANIKHDIPNFYFLREDKLKIENDKFSSSISELLPIILYLKHIVKVGDTLIIEEPESHLHPKNQRILVKYLVRAVNKGLKILLTTHSDYIIEQLDIHLVLNNIPKNQKKMEIQKKYNYSEIDYLDSKDLKVYAFREEENFSFSAYELEFNELGIEKEDMMEIVNELYDESDDIKELLLE